MSDSLPYALIAAAFAAFVYVVVWAGPEHEREWRRRHYDVCRDAYADRGKAVLYEKCGVRP